MAAYVQVVCLAIVSINTALDPGGFPQTPTWQLSLPLLSLHRTVRDILELTIIGRPNEQALPRPEKDSSNSAAGPKLAIKTLNFAAIMATCISLRDREPKALWMKLLVATAMCCWVTGNPNIARRRGLVQDNLPRRIQLAIDITAILISHSTFFMLMTSESCEGIAVRALRCAVWFTPLAAVAVLLAMVPEHDRLEKMKRSAGVWWLQMCFWLGIAGFVGFGDVTRIIVRRDPVGFGGLHSMHAAAIMSHHFAAGLMLAGNHDPVGNSAWTYASIAGFWLGLVGFNRLYVPSIPERSGCRCG